jgi:glycine cleavage system aminomethyltransferase T
MSAIYPFWIAGKPVTSDTVADVVHPGDGKVIGHVTSGGYSPTLKKGIGMAYVDNQHLKVNQILLE